MPIRLNMDPFTEDITVIDVDCVDLPDDIFSPLSSNTNVNNGPSSHLDRGSYLNGNYVSYPDECASEIPSPISMSTTLKNNSNVVPNIDNFINPLSCMQFLPLNPDMSVIFPPSEKNDGNHTPMASAEAISTLITAMSTLNRKYELLNDKHQALQTEFHNFRCESERKQKNLET